MEQRKQQPFQQEQSNLSSSKNFLANPKLPLIAAAVVIILAVDGILLLKAIQPASPADGPAPRDQAELDFAGWQTYHNTKYEFEIKHPADWTVRQANNAFHFLPPGEQTLDKGITLVMIDYNKTPPPPVWYSDTLLRTVEWQGQQISVIKRSPYRVTILYIAEITKNGYVAEFRMFLDTQYDNIFDQILSTFRFIE